MALRGVLQVQTLLLYSKTHLSSCPSEECCRFRHYGPLCWEPRLLQVLPLKPSRFVSTNCFFHFSSNIKWYVRNRKSLTLMNCVSPWWLLRLTESEIFRFNHQINWFLSCCFFPLHWWWPQSPFSCPLPAWPGQFWSKPSTSDSPHGEQWGWWRDVMVVCSMEKCSLWISSVTEAEM